MLDSDGNLVGRAMHPLDGMSYKEFIYCAYTLAVNTDRIEFILSELDIH